MAQARDDLRPIRVGQAQIDEPNLARRARNVHQALAHVGEGRHLVRLRLQPAGQTPTDLLVVVDDQHAHWNSIPHWNGILRQAAEISKRAKCGGGDRNFRPASG